MVRAGLVATLAEQLGAWQIDPEIAYLTANEFRPTPFAKAYCLEESLPFHEEALRARLRELGVGRVTVLKRSSAVGPAALVRGLKLDRPGERVLVLTRVSGWPFVRIGRPEARP